jgi:4-hydroxyacetophenone monooxygenase
MTLRPRPSGLSGDDLDAAVEAANLPTLVMVLVQLTGDLRWLDEPYRPTMPRGLDDHDTGGLPEDRQQEVRLAARAAIAAWLGGAPVVLPDPDVDLITRMLSTSVGEPVGAEYGRFIQAELLAAVAGEAIAAPPSEPAETDLDVIVIGGGVSGICAAVRLGQLGVPYTVLERNHRVGGVWQENKYPAAAVDTPSHLYSYAFAPGDWPRWFGAREHIHEYLEDVARDFGVLPHVRFGVEVTQARYLPDEQAWAVDTVTGDGTRETLRARVVISGVGAFNTPKVPPFPGLETFAGPAFHTARWPEGFEVTGKRVVVVGNGASAMQLVPAIAPEVAALTVFQQEPHWIAPFPKFRTPVPEPVRALLREVPLYHAWYRARLSWAFNDKLHPSLRKDPDWPHPDRSVNLANDRFRQFLVAHIERELGDRTDLLPDVLPAYPPLGKRLLLDNGWYRTLRLDNVRLVSDSLTQVLPTGVRTATGEEIEADVLIFATGFDVVTFLSTIDVVGRSGRALREVWNHDDAAAYLGLAVPDFPNFFILYGPNTQTGHGGSLIGLVEAQMNHIVRVLTQMMERQAGAVEVRTEVFTEYNARVDAEHAELLWTHPKVSNYFTNSRGRVVVNSPYRVVDFCAMAAAADLGDYVVESAALFDTPQNLLNTNL